MKNEYRSPRTRSNARRIHPAQSVAITTQLIYPLSLISHFQPPPYSNKKYSYCTAHHDLPLLFRYLIPPRGSVSKSKLTTRSRPSTVIYEGPSTSAKAVPQPRHPPPPPIALPRPYPDQSSNAHPLLPLRSSSLAAPPLLPHHLRKRTQQWRRLTAASASTGTTGDTKTAGDSSKDRGRVKASQG